MCDPHLRAVPARRKETLLVTDLTVRATRPDSSPALAKLRLPELHALAAELGLRGASQLRKGELVDAITEIQDNASTPPSSAPDAPASTEAAAPVVKKRASRRATTSIVDGGSSEAPIIEATSPKSAKAHVSAGETGVESSTAPAAGTEPAGIDRIPGQEAQREARADTVASEPGEGIDRIPGQEAEREAQADGDQQPRNSRGRNRNRTSADRQPRTEQGAGDQPASEQGERGNNRNGNSRNQQAQGGNNRNQNNNGQNNTGQNNQNTGQNNQDRNQVQLDDDDRSGRNRYRDRKRRAPGAGDDFEPEITEDDVLIPVAGILDVLDNYAFVRTSGYLPGNNDVYVSLGQVKKYNLRKGDAVVGAIRQPREGDNQQGRQKYNAIVKIDSINGQTIDEAAKRVDFSKLTPLYPQERLRLETEPSKLSTRIIDLVSPIGKGQRGLIVSPPKAGKTIVLQQIANAISTNNPEVHLMVVLVDERPEEVTDMQRTVKG
ncbi:MAG: transcription termination factor Rho, partial [Microbacteriaceae bacterium]|nr:transcription termination factor Rho [Microbacteriaceae bacterium]